MQKCIMQGEGPTTPGRVCQCALHTTQGLRMFTAEMLKMWNGGGSATHEMECAPELNQRAGKDQSLPWDSAARKEGKKINQQMQQGRQIGNNFTLFRETGAP